MRPSVVLFVLAALLTTVACSREKTVPSTPEEPKPAAAAAGGDGNGIDPCSLLTREEASDILGEPASAPERKDAGPPMAMRICQWTPAAETGMGLIQISVLRNADLAPSLRANGYSVEKLFEDSLAQLGGEPVPDIGDKAFFSMGGIIFLKGGAHVSVSAGSSSIVEKGEQGLPAARKVAEKAASRL